MIALSLVLGQLIGGQAAALAAIERHIDYEDRLIQLGCVVRPEHVAEVDQLIELETDRLGDRAAAVDLVFRGYVSGNIP